MRKAIRFFYISIFFIICLIPSLFFFTGDTNNSQAENRVLGEMPKIIKDGKLNLKFPAEMDTYFSENFGFRTKMVNLDAQINYSLLGQSSSPKVIVGKDDFLFYYETLNDYLGRDTLNDKSISEIIKTLELMDEYAASKGSKFYFTIAPNKNSIYPEYMPDKYIKGSTNNYRLLKDKINDTDLNFIDLKSFLLNLKKESPEPIYFKLDSHWNNLGAENVYKYLLWNIGLKTNLVDDPPYIKEKSFTGDIYKMLFPDGNEKDYDFIFNLQKNFSSKRPFQDQDINITTNLKTGVIDLNPGKKLMIFRDSFFNSMVKFVSNDFSKVVYTREVPYPMENTYNDIVIFEIAERNIPLIIKNAPKMPAPIRENVDLTKYIKLDRKNIFFYNVQEDDYFHLYGCYISKVKSSNEEVLLKYKDKIFEAFPILESNIKDDIVKKFGEEFINQGFSIRIPKDISVDLDDFDIYIKR